MEDAKKMSTRNTTVSVQRTVKSNTQMKKCKVTANTLNVRTKPDKNATIVTKVSKGEILEVSAVLEGWYAIVYQSETAYISSDFAELIESTNYGKVIANSLNVRNQPNSESTILGKLAKGETIEIVKKYAEWFQINFQGKTGFVARKFVSENEDSTSSNTTTNTNTNTNTNTSTDKKYFYQREDLAKVKLEADTKIAVPSDYKPKIAATIWNNYGNLIKIISEELSFEKETALAVLCVESGGNGFSNGKMIIRFENHVFDLYYGKTNPDDFAKYYDYNRSKRREGHKFRPSEKDEWQECHTNQEMEWKAFDFARALSEKDAIFSISLGAPQVMGFNYKMIGYSSPIEMFEYFVKDIRYHFLALFDFCKYKEARIKYLQDKDFYSFAKEYNGTTAPKAYEERIQEYYDIFKKLLK